MSDPAGTAFVTGGSGFIGGRLLDRLSREGWRVRALARSEASAATVSERGAEPARGDLSDPDAIRAGAEGAEVAFHCAAHLGSWGSREEFEQVNVAGTRNVVEACRAAGVRRLVHTSSEAAVTAGDPLVDVDETAPLRPDSGSLYCATKARAEQVVRDRNGDGIETVVVRPRFVWGRGDRTILPGLVKSIEAGRFAWIGGGRQRTSTTHVDNVVEGLMMAAERGEPGGVYFVTDGDPVVFRDFVSELVATQGVEPPTRSMPAWLAGTVARGGELLWRALPLPGQPPVTRMEYWVSSQQQTIDISRARRELGYEPVQTIPAGMAELREAG
jgi:nucleoside-diphosphate-sugar epimerase